MLIDHQERGDASRRARQAWMSGDPVTSVIPRGFHDPITDCVELMAKTIAANGTVILDLHGRYLAAPDEARSRLIASSESEILIEMPKAKRMAFRKAG